MNVLSYDDVAAALRTDGKCMGLVNPREYHTWKGRLAADFGCPCVSKSVLGDFYRSAFRAHYNEVNGVRKESAWLRKGSMIDCLVLTPQLWGELYKEPWKPQGKYALPWVPWEPKEEKRFALKKNGEPSKNQDPEQKAEWEAAKAADKEAHERFKQEIAAQEAAFEAECQERGTVILKEGEEAEMRACAEQATQHLEALGLVLDVTFRSQVGLFLRLTEIGGRTLETPMIVTAMLDVLPDAGVPRFGRMLVDLKSTSVDVTNTEKLFYTMEDFLYGLQGALYEDVFNAITGEVRDGFAFLFVTQAQPAMSRLVEMDDAALLPYRHMYALLLHRYAHAWVHDDWGSAALDDAEYEPSRKEVAKYAFLMNGVLP